MSTLIRALLAVAVAGAALSAAAQQATPQAGMPMGMSSMPQMQQHMATMQALRTKMAAAKTPAPSHADGALAPALPGHPPPPRTHAERVTRLERTCDMGATGASQPVTP